MLSIQLSKERSQILLTSLSGQLGGMEMRLVDEARFLRDQGYKTCIAVSPFPGSKEWLVELGDKGFSILDFNPPDFFGEWRWRRIKLILARLLWLQSLRSARISLAHVFYAWTFHGGSRLWLCHKAGIPCVLSIHNSFPQANLSIWHHRLMQESFASVRGLYAVSDSALTHFLSTYGKYVRNGTTVEVVPNFVDIVRFIPSAQRRYMMRAELGIESDAFVIGSIGRLDEQKEPFKILDVFERIQSQTSEVYLLFCGQGPLVQSVKQAVNKRTWSSKVRFLGFRYDVEFVFPALDIHILLSKQEGFGIATVEAMACGVPVVASDVPGTRDVVRDSNAGVLVPYADTELTAAVILDILRDNKKCINMGISGRSHAESRYSKTIWEKNLTNFYTRVMANADIK